VERIRIILIVRAHGPGVSFLQFDDLAADQLARLAPAEFLTLDTSRGNLIRTSACSTPGTGGAARTAAAAAAWRIIPPLSAVRLPVFPDEPLRPCAGGSRVRNLTQGAGVRGGVGVGEAGAAFNAGGAC
jgi:hypothetical protein